jgi:hypothetical protein
MQSSTDQGIQRYLGIHRVIKPQGTPPQPAWKLDNTPMALPTETLINVQKLHIDSASFTQIAHACIPGTYPPYLPGPLRGRS